MAIKAYILVETSVGHTLTVVDTIRGFDGIDIVDVVTGPYDIIAVFNAKDMTEIGTLVTEKIHNVEGVLRAVTCIATGN